MKKKPLVIVLCTVLATTAIALGTMAYMTDTAGTVNRFAVGNVTIEVDESAVDSSGTPIPGAPRVEGNDYHLLPGHTYTKDPQVTIGKSSESSYVRMLVTITKARELQAVFNQLAALDPVKYGVGIPSAADWNSAAWPCAGVTEDVVANTITYEFRYHATDVTDPQQAQVVTPDGEHDLSLPPLFTTLTIPGEITGAQLSTIAGLEIRVVGQAIQAGVFPNADEAWSAFEEQVAS